MFYFWVMHGTTPVCVDAQWQHLRKLAARQVKYSPLCGFRFYHIIEIVEMLIEIVFEHQPIQLLRSAAASQEGCS